MNDRWPNFDLRRARRRIVLAVVLTTAVSGYFMGLRQTRSQVSLTRPTELSTPAPASGSPAAAVPVMASYADTNRRRSGPNAGWQSDLRLLIGPPRLVLTTNPPPEFRAAALAQRQARRAFDGAPPTVPHPIPQDSTAACLACHGPALAVKDRVASRIPHAHHTSCTQCHVSTALGPVPAADTAFREPLTGNDFLGLAGYGPGTRAWPGAPPTIPHPTAMRTDCLSCHGPAGLYGLRTPHVERAACTQCHAPDARREQRLFTHD